MLFMLGITWQMLLGCLLFSQQRMRTRGETILSEFLGDEISMIYISDGMIFTNLVFISVEWVSGLVIQ